ncbi:MAG: type I restriction endonuclease subunit S [Methylobacterium sp.]|nr:MAG: type I restriction endonuclease subunit S [Methylobacterium sp.]
MVGEPTRHRVSALINCGVIALGDGYRAKNSELGDKGLPFARAGNIDGQLLFDGADLIDVDTINVPAEKLSRPNDTVFTSKGTVGRFARVKTDTPQFVYSPQLCYWRSLNQEKIDAGYLYYWLTGPEFYSQYKGVSGQTDMAEYVSLGDQRAMSITLPDIERQRSIATLLGSLDDKIELNRRMAATLEEMARALFKSWFVDFDPVRAKAEGRDPGLPAATAALFPDRFGDDGLPVEWSEKSLLDQATWVNGAAYKDMHFSDAPDALPVVKIAELKNGLSEGTKWTNTDLGDRYRIRDGEMLFSWSGSPDTSIDTFLWVHGDAWLNQHVFVVRPNGEASEAHLFAMLKFLKPTLIEIARDKQTTGLGHVTRQDMIRLKVCVAQPNVRAAFDNIAEPLFDRLKLVLRENARLAVTRDTLLPKLISGELRIKDMGKDVEAA